MTRSFVGNGEPSDRRSAAAAEQTSDRPNYCKDATFEYFL